MKNSKEIREQFLKYFESKKHKVVESGALIPNNDPTLIFVNAGMVPFKNIFLGIEDRGYKTATTSQKCMRVSGKHNDLENVGKTARHHTFFEMLGNFSFGDYFKKDAIKYAWEFLTDILKLDKDKLWITVYHEDDEAYSIWVDDMKLPEERVVKMGAKTNFWSMGDIGPCGPCSEIHIDQGEDFSCGDDCGLGVCDCDRYLEIWNLVFMEYDRDSDGKLTPLPAPSIDTGMGLERLTAIVQNKKSNYDTDLFLPIIEKVSELVGKKYGENIDDDISMRVIADHARSTSFLISEGVIPSNEGRGYVLRRVMRRGIRFGKKLGFQELFFDKICEKVINLMKDSYPQLSDEFSTIIKIVKNEEKKFSKTLDQGEKLLFSKMDKLKDENIDIIDGDTLFLLYDAYGFPIDLSELIAVEKGFKIDKDGFKVELEKQRERSRANQKGKVFGENIDKLVDQIYKQYGETEFVGYQNIEHKGELLAIIEGDQLSDLATEDSGEVLFITDKTPFYAESGGQVGDCGVIKFKNGVAEVKDVQKTTQNIFYHQVVVKSGVFSINDIVELFVDDENRGSTARNHTATHLLQSALKNIVGDHIHQEGSYVDPYKLRFDFNHFEGLTFEQIQQVENRVNSYILKNSVVEIKNMGIKDAKNMGAIALFGEKYGDQVRTVKISKDSFELCGGTHVSRSGDIGYFKIISESSIASGIRRIEAVTGFNAYKMVQKEELKNRELLSILKANKDNFLDKAKETISKNRLMEREIDQLKKEVGLLKLNQKSSESGSEKIDIGSNSLIFRAIDGITPKELKGIADELKSKTENGIIYLVSKGKKGAQVVVMRGKNCDIHCGNLLRGTVTKFGGRGGGKDGMAQGGAPSDLDIDKLKESVVEFLKQ